MGAKAKSMRGLPTMTTDTSSVELHQPTEAVAAFVKGQKRSVAIALKSSKVAKAAKTNHPPFKSIDLFAGIGGIRLGFENAFRSKIKTVFVSEWDEHAKKTYSSNFGNRLSIAGDITRVSADDIPNFDICLAGFPCQAFSMAGRRMGFDDYHRSGRRGLLFFEVARICKAKRPKVIFCENVKGLLIHDGGKTISIIKDTLKSIGYKVFAFVLNSKDFGVPQNRERIYIVAFREDVAPDMFEPPKPLSSPPPTLRDIIQTEPIDGKYYLSEVY